MFIKVRLFPRRQKVHFQAKQLRLRMAAHYPAQVEGDGAGQSEVREQQGTSCALQDLISLHDAQPHVRQRHAAQVRHPGSVHGNRYQSRARRNDRMAKAGVKL